MIFNKLLPLSAGLLLTLSTPLESCHDMAELGCSSSRNIAGRGQSGGKPKHCPIGSHWMRTVPCFNEDLIR